uniref:Myb/SANT-like domain-containing protein n=1 Tax=Amphimedon queenslandica TaxID=400682 RepID=A0A1X7VSV0_AMPQE
MATRIGKHFKWTDDECELMLSVTRDYKVQQMAVNVDWESMKTKYGDILAMMPTELPVNAPTTRSQPITGKDYPHAKSELTKAITTKLKAVRQNYCQAVDTGRKSGQSRVVLLYFDQCETIWAGSQSTEQIDTGLESRDLQTASEGNY